MKTGTESMNKFVIERIYQKLMTFKNPILTKRVNPCRMILNFVTFQAVAKQYNRIINRT